MNDFPTYLPREGVTDLHAAIDTEATRAAGAARLISVLIPAHGRPTQLAACLDALAAQDLPAAEFEIIICDDGSPAPLRDALASQLAGMPPALRVSIVRQAQRGPAAARNNAARHATGRVLAFTDDDCLPARDWLASLVARLDRDPHVLVGGDVENALPDNLCSAATQMIVSFISECHERRGSAVRFFTTSNLAVPAAGFLQLGGFSESFPLAAGEDYDFCARWQERGMRAVYAREVRIRHAHPLSLRSFVRQHFNYGRGSFLMRQRLAERRGERLRGEALRFYAGLIRYPLQRERLPRGLLCAGLVLLAQAATACGVVRAALSRHQAAARSGLQPARNSLNQP
jgi:cellulose synthase/poly-beta-1,6-N-acetylglucosamine synthase-like glycosyltransferase